MHHNARVRVVQDTEESCEYEDERWGSFPALDVGLVESSYVRIPGVD